MGDWPSLCRKWVSKELIFYASWHKINKMNVIRISVWDGRIKHVGAQKPRGPKGEGGPRRLWARLTQPALLLPPWVMPSRMGLFGEYSILPLFSYVASLIFQPPPYYTRA